ncbi:MAG: cytochrome c biogenesis protein CcsA [Deferribacteraceae bacterium]|jgi:cytochrome c-type biogenesis protein CcmF|nr:cytochrome c biogenesis protein CcsA [Deferribacteraceae bacterium]
MQMGQGFVVQVFAIFLGFLAIVMYIATINEKTRTSTFKIAGGLLAAQTLLITISVFILLNALVTSDFAYVYVFSYTERSLSLPYKVSALWAGQAGSLLFWSWLASIFTVFELWRIREHGHKYQSYVLLVSLITTTFFLILCTFVTNPFEMMPFSRMDGQGMNPMLQNPGMMIHPPLLYIGFVGFMIPFAHSIAALNLKDASPYWVKNSRPWTIFTWIFLTAGIVLGAWWAYVELGWGGYWAWDPVENASLFPWITATAFIHAAIIYERRNRMKGWSHCLSVITFGLTVFGTYLTRSGIMSDSVHSFGKSALGNFFIFFLLLTTAVFIVSFYKNRRELADKTNFNFTSKEGVFFLALLCFLALTLALIFYTMLPVLSEIILSNKMSVSIASFNFVSIPFFTVIFFLAGIGLIISYNKMNPDQFVRQYIPVLIASLIAVAVVIGLGFRGVSPLVISFAASTVFFAFLFQGVRMIMKSGVTVIYNNRRFFGAAVVHIGLAMMAFGVVFSSFYSYESDEMTSSGSSFVFDRYTLAVGDVEHEDGRNYEANYVTVDVYQQDKLIFTLYPELREYYKSQNIFGEVAYRSMMRGDLYTILQGFDKGQNIVRLSVIFQPLIVWIWVGSILMCLGAAYAVTQNKSALKQANDSPGAADTSKKNKSVTKRKND